MQTQVHTKNSLPELYSSELNCTIEIEQKIHFQKIVRIVQLKFWNFSKIFEIQFRIVQFSIVQLEMSQNQSLPMSTTFGRRLFPRSSVILLTDRHRQTDRQTERMITLLRRYQQQTTRRKMWITSLGRCQVEWRSVHTAVESQLRVLSSRESSVETTPHATPAYHLHHNNIIILIIILISSSSKQTHIPSHLTVGTYMPTSV